MLMLVGALSAVLMVVFKDSLLGLVAGIQLAAYGFDPELPLNRVMWIVSSVIF